VRIHPVRQFPRATCIAGARFTRPPSIAEITLYRGDPLAYLMQRLKSVCANSELTLGDLFDSLIEPGFLAADDSRYAIRVADDARSGCAALGSILELRGAAVDAILRRKHQDIGAYYKHNLAFSSARRALIFDCGYSGSVSANVMKVTGQRIDKVYLYKTRLNDMRDLLNRTKTYLLVGGLSTASPTGIVNVFEEIFAAPDDQCIGITSQADGFRPVFDHSHPLSETTCANLADLQDAAMCFVRDMQSQFGDYLDQLELDSIGFAVAPLMASLGSRTDMSIRHLENIHFPDSFFGDARSLADKIEPRDREHLLRTPFVDPANTVSTPSPSEPRESLRIAIHLHLFHPEAAESFISRLTEFPAPFDFYISVCRDRDLALARILFAQPLAHRIGKLDIRLFPNRGRDVGAWVAGFGGQLMSYDLVAHLHTKQSKHFTWGTEWREYLLDNLIGADAFRDIQRHFISDPGLGLVFPPLYKDILDTWGNRDLPQLEEVDRQNCLDLMRRMRISGTVSKHSLLFSAGTMLWYRPAALAPLMTAGIGFEDFPEEPIGISGTLAHAVERLPAVIARHQNYSTRCYVRSRDKRHSYRMATCVHIVVNRVYWLVLKVLPPGTGRYRLARRVFFTCMSRIREGR